MLYNMLWLMVLQAARGLVPELKVFEWLIDRVAPAFTKTAIQHTELMQLLGTDTRHALQPSLKLQCKAGVGLRGEQFGKLG